MRSKPLTEAIRKAGGVTALATAAGVKPQAVSQWGNIPPMRALLIESELDIPRHELRPDLWEAPAAATQKLGQPAQGEAA